MSLERKDVRLKLDPDDHAALRLLADAEGLELGEWAEVRLVTEIRRRLHAAIVLAEEARRLGIAGIGRERPGMAGNGRESQGMAGSGRE